MSQEDKSLLPFSLSPHLSAHFSLPLSPLSSCTAGHWLHQSLPVMSFSIKHTVAKQLPISRRTRLSAPATHQHSRPIRWVSPLSRFTVIRKYKGSEHNLQHIFIPYSFFFLQQREERDLGDTGAWSQTHLLQWIFLWVGLVLQVSVCISTYINILATK